MKKEPLGNKIRMLRLANGKSQIAFAESVGISQAYLARIEKNEKIPAYSLILTVNKEYGVDFSQDWLNAKNEIAVLEMEQAKKSNSKKKLVR